MPKQSDAQKETVGRVMHEFTHGELKMAGGKGPKVKNPKQAIAIALREAGASNRESPAKNAASLRRTKANERAGTTAQAEARWRGSREELYAEAKKRNIPGRSKMSAAELKHALGD